MRIKIKREKILNSHSRIIIDSRKKKKVANREAKDTYLKIKNTIIQTNRDTNKGMLKGKYLKQRPRVAPMLVDTPLPPLKRKNILQLWPAIDAKATKMNNQ